MSDISINIMQLLTGSAILVIGLSFWRVLNRTLTQMELNALGEDETTAPPYGVSIEEAQQMRDIYSHNPNKNMETWSVLCELAKGRNIEIIEYDETDGQFHKRMEEVGR